MLYYTDQKSRQGEIWENWEVHQDQFNGDTEYEEDRKYTWGQNLKPQESGMKSFIEIECHW